MQPLTAAPRDAYTEAQIHALLVAPDIKVGFGCNLLNPDLSFLEDISQYVSAVKVSRNNLANVHGTVDMVISHELAWGLARVMPRLYMTSLTAGVTRAQFNLGVYLLSTPAKVTGESPLNYAVTGFDQLLVCQNDVGDSYSVTAGTNVLTAVRTAFTAAGVQAPLLLDTSGSAKVLAVTRSWLLTSDSSPTWLNIINDLLAAIGYRGLWVDWDGAFRGTPYVLPSDRAPEFVFEVGSMTKGVVASRMTITNDVWGCPNAWVFVGNNWPTAPVAGDGRYETSNPDVGPSSQASVGRIVRAPVQFLDAVDQASLVTQGDRIKASDMRSTEVTEATCSPLPIAWHADVATWNTRDGVSKKVLNRSWSFAVDAQGASDMDYAVETVV